MRINPRMTLVLHALHRKVAQIPCYTPISEQKRNRKLTYLPLVPKQAGPSELPLQRRPWPSPPPPPPKVLQTFKITLSHSNNHLCRLPRPGIQLPLRLKPTPSFLTYPPLLLQPRKLLPILPLPGFQIPHRALCPRDGEACSQRRWRRGGGR